MGCGTLASFSRAVSAPASDGNGSATTVAVSAVVCLRKRRRAGKRLRWFGIEDSELSSERRISARGARVLEPDGNTNAYLQREEIQKLNLAEHLGADARVVLRRRTAIPGGTGVDKYAGRQPIDTHWRHHCMAIDVHDRCAEFQRRQARIAATQLRFIAAITAQREVTFVEFRHRERKERYRAAELIGLGVAVGMDLDHARREHGAAKRKVTFAIEAQHGPV